MGLGRRIPGQQQLPCHRYHRMAALQEDGPLEKCSATAVVVPSTAAAGSPLLTSSSSSPTLRCRVITIIWHASNEKQESVLCADYHPSQPLLATGGFDKCVKLWTFDPSRAMAMLSDEAAVEPTFGIDFASTLVDDITNAQCEAVNDVKWSPSGQLLAAAYDDGFVILYIKDATKRGNKTGGERDDLRQYNLPEFEYCTYKVLRGHSEGVYALSFSAAGDYVFSGAMHGKVLIHEVKSGNVCRSFDDHDRHCQGVACDPLGRYAASVSADKTLRFYQNTAALNERMANRDEDGAKAKKQVSVVAAPLGGANWQVVPGHVVSKLNTHVPTTTHASSTTTCSAGAGALTHSGLADVPKDAAAATGIATSGQIEEPPHGGCETVDDEAALPSAFHLFKGELASSFFRRMSWSPDGLLLAVPCGTWIEPTAASPPAVRQQGNSHHQGASAPRKSENCAHLFIRSKLIRPILSFCLGGGATILGCRFCPVLFAPLVTAAADERGDNELVERGDDGARPLPDATQDEDAWGPPDRRYALALWTADDVVVYCSHQHGRYGSFRDLHYEKITDVAWSNDGRFLFIASLDGYVSLAALTGLGDVLPLVKLGTHAAQLQLKLKSAGDAFELAIAASVATKRMAAMATASVTTAAVVRKKPKRIRTPSPDRPAGADGAEGAEDDAAGRRSGPPPPLPVVDADLLGSLI